MAEFIEIPVQEVAVNQNVVFNETSVSPTRCIMHRTGSGIVTLKGLTEQCRARFLVSFSGNIAISAGGTVEPISVAISLQGEPLQSARMSVTPAAAGDFWNVSAQVYVDVPKCCCETVAVTNTSTQAIEVQNANLIAVRVA